MNLQNIYLSVQKFHELFEMTVNNGAETPTKQTINLRKKLLFEEIDEYNIAVKNLDYVEIVDGLCDIMYVFMGMVVSFGKDFCYINEITKLPVYKQPPLTIEEVKTIVNNTRSPTMFEFSVSISKLFYYCEKDFENNKNKIAEYINKSLIQLICVIDMTINNFDKCFNEVHRSNMTKLCNTEEEANMTIEQYKEKNIIAAFRYGKTELNKNSIIVYNVETNKTLKSCNYSKCDLTKFI